MVCNSCVILCVLFNVHIQILLYLLCYIVYYVFATAILMCIQFDIRCVSIPMLFNSHSNSDIHIIITYCLYLLYYIVYYVTIRREFMSHISCVYLIYILTQFGISYNEYHTCRLFAQVNFQIIIHIYYIKPSKFHF